MLAQPLQQSDAVQLALVNSPALHALLAQRWADPIFPINFPWFGSSDYWSGQVDMLVDQTEAMQAAALVA